MPKLRIRDWQARFENSRSRELKSTNWVPIPNSFDSLEYIELVTQPNGPALYAAWIAMVQIASRQPVRGTIPQGGATIPQALAAISRLPATLFVDLITILLKWQWIEEVTDMSQEGATIPHPAATISQEGAQKEGNERKKGSEAAASASETDTKNKPKPDTDDSPIEDLVRTTANELHRLHAAAGLTPGPVGLTESALVEVLAGAVGPERIAASIVAAHPQFVPVWQQREKAKRGSAPRPSWWIRDGEYLHPPATIQAVEKPVYRDFDRNLVPK